MFPSAYRVRSPSDLRALLDSALARPLADPPLLLLDLGTLARRA